MITLDGPDDRPLDTMDPGLADPVFKCIQGDYSGRFAHVSCCQSGEQKTPGLVIGGGRLNPAVNQNPYEW